VTDAAENTAGKKGLLAGIGLTLAGLAHFVKPELFQSITATAFAQDIDKHLKVNGSIETVTVSPETPLLFVLRNELKLTGPRLGCGMAQCGACAVLVDGKEIRACITPVSFAVGKQVTTIEGLPTLWAARRGASPADSAETLHPVQQAWIDEQVPQCGYCQPGFIMATAALLKARPKPTDQEIDDALSNICRCGTYGALRRAVHRAAASLGGS